MKVNKRKSKSIFKIVVILFIVFTGIIILLGLLIVALASYRTKLMEKRPEKEKMSVIASTLVSNNFSEKEVEELLGVDAILDVYNLNLEIVYSYGDKNSEDTFVITPDEMGVIPIYDERSVVVTEQGVSESGEKITIIKTTNYIEEDNIELSMIVLDEEFNVIYSSEEMTKEKYTESEVKYLSQQMSSDHYIYKYPFENGNESFIMVIRIPKHETVIDNLFLRSYLIDAIAFCITYIVVFSIFIIVIKQRFQKPILLLNNAINDVANGRRSKMISYKGASEFEQICESFDNMAEKLELSEQKRIEIEKEKEKLVCNISHDLKTPITVIHGYIKAINDGLIPEENREKYLQIIYNKSKDLVELINDFHEFNKFNHPDFQLDFECLDYCEFSREYLADRYDEIELQGFSFDIDIPDRFIKCNIDKLQMKRVFENIIGNSIKHNTPGKTILFKIEESESYIVISIGDNGKGIEDSIAENMFNPFIGAEDNNNIKSGLGLYICKRIVEAHGGTIIYKKSKIYNSIFEITLPKVK